MKRTMLLCFFILSGVILGGLLANLCTGVPALSWLAYSNGISVHPVLDLSVVKLDLEFYMGISVAQIITIALSIFLYNRTPLR